MNDQHIHELLFDYVEGVLGPAEAAAAESHLQGCAACRAELEHVRRLSSATARLPRSIDPPTDLWPGIEYRLRARPVARTVTTQNGLAPVRDRSPRLPSHRRVRPAWPVRIGVLVLLLTAGAGLFWITRHDRRAAWEVVQLEGTPRIGSHAFTHVGKLQEGDWLETDPNARARIDVGEIGHVNVQPGTRIGIKNADPENHRLALTRGTIEARIWAPPRLFFVETPSALAVDLGCAYTLSVDSSGASLLTVTSGWVALESGEREIVVPAGAMCQTRRGRGPGTPFDQAASAALRRALARFDFENGGASALDEILNHTEPHDAITLWHLLRQTDGRERERVYDRLLSFESPPEGVTRAGILAGDSRMLELWEQYLGLDYDGWWSSEP